MVLTYGKKKGLVLPSLSVRPVPDGILKVRPTRKKDHAPKMDGQTSTRIVDSKDRLHDAFFKNDYNIDELASMLLEDTIIEQVITQPDSLAVGGRLSQPQPSPSGSSAIRGLTWFDNSSDDTLSTMKSIKVSHLRPRPQGSRANQRSESVAAPPIPRKSSKRVAKQRIISDSLNESKFINQNSLDQLTKPLPKAPDNKSLDSTHTSPQILQSNVTDKNLRGLRKQTRGVVDEPYVSGMLRPAIKNRSISSMTIRENEVVNLNNPKILSHIGFDVGYDSVSDYARLSKPYKLSGTGSFRNAVYTTTSGRGGQHPGASDVTARSISDSIPRLTYSSYEYCGEQPNTILEDQQLSYDVHPGALVSSSPIAQSTPRVRSIQHDGSMSTLPELDEIGSLEVNRSYGRLFDISNSNGVDAIKRKNSQVREAGSTMKTHLAKRIRKHLSPRHSKLLLRKAEQDPGIHDASESANLNRKNHFIPSLNGIKRNTILAPKDPNAEFLQHPRHQGTERVGSRISIKSELTPHPDALSYEPKRSCAPKPLVVSNGRTLSMVLAQSEPQIQKSHSTGDGDSDSMMDTDELQWDDPMYNIVDSLLSQLLISVKTI